MKKGRRAFVSGSGFALAGIAAGTVSGLSSSAAGQTSKASGIQVASFGWEVTNLDNNGADVYFRVRNSLTLTSVNIDTAFMITAQPANPGFAEILCRAAVSRGAPQFVQGDTGAAFVSPQSPDFGTVEIYNPNRLNVGNDGFLLQDIFYSVILKTWVPASGTASSTSRHVNITSARKLTADEYLVFNMSHAGVSGDAEMQVVLEYAVP